MVRCGPCCEVKRTTDSLLGRCGDITDRVNARMPGDDDGGGESPLEMQADPAVRPG